jgi:hypothetical protein
MLKEMIFGLTIKTVEEREEITSIFVQSTKNEVWVKQRHHSPLLSTIFL